MKKIIALLLCALCVLALFGCNKEPDNTEATTDAGVRSVSVEPIVIDESKENETYTKADGSYDVNYFVEGSNSFDTICKYDDKGELSECRAYDYDADGNCISERVYNADKSFASEKVYDYNDDNTINKIWFYNDTGALDYYSVYVYDKDGTLLATPYYDANDKLLNEAVIVNTTAAE